MRIVHNVPALFSHRRLLDVNQAIKKNLERLSTGLRINRAADDAAGLQISESMRSQIRGLQQANRNAEDGISLVQTAEAGLHEIHEMLQRMRELAVQAATDTMSDSDRKAIQVEIDQLVEEIDRMAEGVEYNNIKLFSVAGGEAGKATAFTGKETVTDQSGMGPEGTYTERKIDVKKPVDEAGFEGSRVIGGTITIANAQTGGLSSIEIDIIKKEVKGKKNATVLDITTQSFGGVDLERAFDGANIHISAAIGFQVGTQFARTHALEGYTTIRAFMQDVESTAATLSYNGTNIDIDITYDSTTDKFRIENRSATSLIIADISQGATAITSNQTGFLRAMQFTNPGTNSIQLEPNRYKESLDDVAAIDITQSFQAGYNADPPNKDARLRVIGPDGAEWWTSQMLTSYNAISSFIADFNADQQISNAGVVLSYDKVEDRFKVTNPNRMPIKISDTLEDGFLVKSDIGDARSVGRINFGKTITEIMSEVSDIPGVTMTYDEDTDTFLIEHEGDIYLREKPYDYGLIGFFSAINISAYNELEPWGENPDGGERTATTPFASGFYAGPGKGVKGKITNVREVVSDRAKSLDLTAKGIDPTGGEASSFHPLANSGFEMTPTGKISIITSGNEYILDLNRGAPNTNYHNVVVTQAGVEVAKYHVDITNLKEIMDWLERPQDYRVYSPALNGYVNKPGPGLEVEYKDDRFIIRSWNEFQLKEYPGLHGAAPLTVAENGQRAVNNQDEALGFWSALNITQSYPDRKEVTALSLTEIYEEGIYRTSEYLGLQFHIGANKDQTIRVDIENVTTEKLNVRDKETQKPIQLTTRDNANQAIQILDDAIDRVSKWRANLGAYQNRLNHIIDYVRISEESMTASESRIRDVDMAREMSDYVKNQILSQTSVTMLAQANMMPQTILALLG